MDKFSFKMIFYAIETFFEILKFKFFEIQHLKSNVFTFWNPTFLKSKKGVDKVSKKRETLCEKSNFRLKQSEIHLETIDSLISDHKPYYYYMYR
jgi:hypothetical protein